MAEIGAAILGGSFALAAANYTSCAGFTARHETVHAHQVADMNRLIAEFENAYEKKKVKQEEWELFSIIRDKAREVEAKYEDSIEMYKETPLYRFIAKWKARRQVQKKKKELRSRNRSLRSHWNSCSSSVSSISGEHGSSAPSSASYTDVDETRKWVLAWAKQVADSDDGHDSEVRPLCPTFRLVKKGHKLTRKARAAVRRRNASRKSGGGEAGPNPALNNLNANASKVQQDSAGHGPPGSSVSNMKSGTRYSWIHVDPCAQLEENTSLSREPTIRPNSGSGDTLVSPQLGKRSEVSCNDGVPPSVLLPQDVRGGGRCARRGVRRYKAGSDADSEGGAWDSGASNADDEDGLASASFGPIYRTSEGQVSQHKICVENASTSRILVGGAQWSGEYDEAYFQVPHEPAASPVSPQPSTQSSLGFHVLRDMQEQSQHPQHPHHHTIEDHSPTLELGLDLDHERARFASSDATRDFGQLNGHQNQGETEGEYSVGESTGEEFGGKSLRTWLARAPSPSKIPEFSEPNMPSYPTCMLLQHGIHMQSHYPFHHLQHFIHLLRSGLGHGYYLRWPYSGQHMSFPAAVPISYLPIPGAHANVGSLVAYGGEEGDMARNDGASAQGRGDNFYVTTIPATSGESTCDVGGTTTMPAAVGGYALHGCYAPVHESMLRRHPTL